MLDVLTTEIPLSLELHATTINVKAHITTHASINSPYGSTLFLTAIPVKSKRLLYQTAN